jgi:predicted transcriptional regulator
MKNEFKKIRKFLPAGFSKTLAKEFSVSEATVVHALKGKNKHFDIVKRAIEMAKVNMQIKEELTAVIQMISSEHEDTLQEN